MDELEQSLENLDELRREAKDYANTLVLPSDERLEREPQDNTERQAELLEQREQQEAKWSEEIKMNEEISKKPLYIRGYKSDRTEEEIRADRLAELREIREQQEAKWLMDSEKSFIGIIIQKAKDAIRNAQPKNDNFLEEVAEVAEKADSILSQEQVVSETEELTEVQTANLEQNTLMEDFPNVALESVKDEELLFGLEKENGRQKEKAKSRVLARQQGSVFSSILIILTTLTVGIIAAVMVMR